jgi:predicted TIM-barrel fold metal-dependent hydrolase
LAGLGRHYEVGIEFVWMVLADIDRHPNLQVILGHWGEVVIFYLERLVMLMSLYTTSQSRRDSEKARLLSMT